MPRARILRPEFWSDEKLAKLSRTARLVFAGLWTVSDDYGVCKGNVSWLRSQIFPYDEDVDLGFMRGLLEEIERLSRIIHFESDGENYYYIPSFEKHQKVKNPSHQRNPLPPADILSRAVPVGLPSGSVADPESLPSGSVAAPEGLPRTRARICALTETETETETETDSETDSLVPACGGDNHGPAPAPEDPPKPSTKQPPCPYQEIAEIYHEELPSNPHVVRLDANSQKCLQTRWREDPARQSLDWWRQFFQYVKKSDFLMGRKTDFIADLMWLVRPMNFSKVIGGRYHHKNPFSELPKRTQGNLKAAAEVINSIRKGEL